MPMTETPLYQGLNLLDIVRQTLRVMQAGMVKAARNIKAQALAQSRSVADLAGDADIVTADKLTWLARVQDIRDDPAKWAALLAVINGLGFTQSDLVTPFAELRGYIVAFRNAPMTTYPEIIAACDTFLAEVPYIPGILHPNDT